MIALLAGLGLLVVLLLGADAFSRAKVASIKRLLAWVAALGGISLAALLLLSGRAGGAISALIFAAPLVISWWQESGPRARPRAGPGAGARRGGAMSRAEARAILGVGEAASVEDINDAWKRLMVKVHPDHGGTDALAARVNEARRILLG
jgi:DnaJ homolog subfamily C member 19